MAPYTENLKAIVSLTNETLSIYPSFIGDWVFETFKVPMATHQEASKDITYDWLLTAEEAPLDASGKLAEEWMKEHCDIKTVLIQADNLLKKAKKAIQLVWDDMVEADVNNENNKKVKEVSLGINKIQDKIVDTMNIDQVRVERDPPVTTDFIPEELRNMQEGEERNLRDWIILRDVRTILSTIAQLFSFIVVDNE